MKTKAVKILMITMIAGSMMAACPIGVLAEGESYLYGLWDTENYDHLIFVPDGYVYTNHGREEGPYCAYEVTGDDIVFDVETMPQALMEGVEDPVLKAELVDIKKDSLSEFGDKFEEDGYYVKEGTDKMLVITASQTDVSDPLSPTTVEETQIACKSIFMEDYLLLLLGNKTWELDGNLLTMEDKGETLELDLSLNGGERTGKVRVGFRGEVRFLWDGGSTVEYAYVTADTESVTLTDSLGETLILKAHKE